RVLGSEPLSIYIRLDRLPAMARVDVLLEAAGRGRQPARAGQEVSARARRCETEWTQTSGALVDDVGLALRMGQGAWEAHAAWALSPLGRAGLALGTVDDGLVDGGA